MVNMPERHEDGDNLEELIKAVEKFDQVDRMVVNHISRTSHYALVSGYKLGKCKRKECELDACALDQSEVSEETVRTLHMQGRLLAVEAIIGALNQLDVDNRRALLLTKTPAESIMALARNQRAMVEGLESEARKLIDMINDVVSEEEG